MTAHAFYNFGVMPVPQLRVLDYFLLLTAIAVAILSIFTSSSGGQGQPRAEIEASGVTYLMPLSNDAHLDLKGPVGNTRVEVNQKEVYIVDSDCRDKICIAMGHISTPSGWIACLPNRIFIRVVSSSPESYNGVEVDSGAF